MQAFRHYQGWRSVLMLVAALVVLASGAGAQDPVTVTVDLSGNAVPNGIVTATATIDIQDGSTLQSIAWEQAGGVPATLEGADTATLNARLGRRFRYRARLAHVLDEPPVGPEQLPPNVPLPEGEFPGGLQDRFEVVGINPFSLEEAGLVTLEVAVTTTSGTYHAEAEIHTALPWEPTYGIRSVPVGVPVLLQGKEQGSYDWALTPPMGSNATLDGATGRNPELTPDVPGLYEITVTDEAAAAPVTLTVYVGHWRGIIVGQDADGRPVVDGLCTACHRDEFAPDKFTPWAQTGHAEIFTNNLNSSGFYNPGCFDCHSVGFETAAANSGFDDAPDFQAFMGSGLLGNPGDNWTTVLEQFPQTASLANVQCENCHGPASSEPGLDTLAHGWRSDVEGEPRVSLSANVCARCHGEPLRHARFQQWQLSAHANYELAIEEGESGNCSRCHTVNGFLSWLPVLQGKAPGDPLDNIEVTWTTDETHPQTCVTCHDPHDIGTTSGIDTNATVRISGETPPLIAGFQVFGAGRGALCMTCHNSRRGLRNDDVFAAFVGTSEAARAPHGSAQTDVLMGENAYLVNTGIRGRHSLVEDTCVQCHMETTPPPDVLSYNQGGTNHTFFARDDICAECHNGIRSAEPLQSVVTAVLDHLQGLVEAKVLELIGEQIAAGYTVDLNGDALIDDVADIAEIVFGESRGRQAITVTLAGGAMLGPVRMNDIDVIRPEPLGTVSLYDVADEGLIKAGWNYNLVNNDGSRGVHNPSFVLTVLDASRDALGSQGGPRAVLPPEMALK